MMKSQIYLDYAAATPVDEQVLEAMSPYFATKFYNPSSLYLDSRGVQGDINEARKQIAYWLGSKPDEIIFTSGGTEANNLAIHGVMQQYPEGNVVISAIEHDSVLGPASQHDVRVAPVKPNGIIDMDELEELIDEKTALVSVIYANNEVGTLQPLRKISQIIKTENRKRTTDNKKPLLFHTDASQASNYLDLHTTGLGVDLLSLNGGKIYGPKSSGALYVSSGLRLQPQVFGGGQELGLRSGTQNVPAIIGLAKALDIAQAMRKEESKRLKELRQDFINILNDKIPEAVINGSIKHRLPNNVHITIPNQDNERLIMALDERGILCAAGSACSASKDEPSHVLRAMGISDTDTRSSLRFTMGRQTTKANIVRAVNELAKLL